MLRPSHRIFDMRRPLVRKAALILPVITLEATRDEAPIR